MAGIAVPENIRPVVAGIAKYHFWILAAIAPLVLVPLLFAGGADLRGRITTKRREIESKVGQARAVTAVQPHPNEGWRTAIDADAESATSETRDEWRRLWHSQRGFRTWPSELGDAFLKDVSALKPGGKLDRQSLVRYQNMAPRLARTLPARMGVKDLMVEESRDGITSSVAQPASPALDPPLSWSVTSQKRLYDSFVWTRVPNTTQVLMAQEELWVYGLFCDLLAGFVKGATGAHDSNLTNVEELLVGFPAGVEPAESAQRIVMPKASPETPPDGSLPGMMDAQPAPEPAQQPWHPRFTGGGPAEPRPEGFGAPGEQTAASPEDAYRGWVYTDFNGKPLAAAELDAAPDMSMVHLMPFVLRVVVDQRHLDRLLITLAKSQIPIDVRQVRVNPGQVSAETSLSGFQPGGPMPGGSSRRQNHILVELRGSVALAARPTAAAAPQEVAP